MKFEECNELRLVINTVSDVLFQITKKNRSLFVNLDLKPTFLLFYEQKVNKFISSRYIVARFVKIDIFLCSRKLSKFSIKLPMRKRSSQVITENR